MQMFMKRNLAFRFKHEMLVYRQALCKELHEKIIVIDEERYNLEHKAIMVTEEVMLFYNL